MFKFRSINNVNKMIHKFVLCTELTLFAGSLFNSIVIKLPKRDLNSTQLKKATPTFKKNKDFYNFTAKKMRHETRQIVLVQPLSE